MASAVNSTSFLESSSVLMFCAMMPMRWSLGITTLPPSGMVAPVMILKMVLFPAPLGPTIPTLSPEERSAGRVRFFSEKTGSFVPLWDDSGKVIYPYTPDAPVFGVSLEVARQYCAWLGKKLDRPIRLPEYAEWNRAAFSFDSDGNSAYGVTDLNRNVRELLASKSSGVFNRNIGFRYVMDLNSK